MHGSGFVRQTCASGDHRIPFILAILIVLVNNCDHLRLLAKKSIGPFVTSASIENTGI